ncbi:hypothetical protein L9F63_013411, partial [Diploptera punctata]
VPKTSPVISGFRRRYRVADILQGNCSSSWSKPAAKLTWFINDNPLIYVSPLSTHKVSPLR